MTRSLYRYEHFWKSGNYLLHKFKEGGDVADHCLIYDLVEDGYVPIEDMNDYTLGNDIIKRMEAEGVPIVRELPPGAFFLERVRMELLESGVGDDADSFNQTFGELVDMKKSGYTNENIRQRLQELIQGSKP